MNEEKQALPEIRGYINFEELKRSLLQGFGQATLGGMAVYVAVVIGESAHLWYTGPQSATVIMLATSVAAFLRTRMVAKRYIAQGETLDTIVHHSSHR